VSGRSCIKACAVALLSVLASISNALGWGWEGHRVVAEIAEQYLVIEAARQVRDLLARENSSTLAEVSTWADQIRLQRQETARWHFVNIPIYPHEGTPAGYDLERDCLRSDCVVAKIAQFAGVLGGQEASPSQRL